MITIEIILNRLSYVCKNIILNFESSLKRITFEENYITRKLLDRLPLAAIVKKRYKWKIQK